jgi:basic membrane lipoprotein Med (substrate-binding protein (PBP1-ABC) superfamily)
MSNTTPKLWRLLAILLALVLVAAACGDDDDAADTSGDDTSGDDTSGDDTDDGDMADDELTVALVAPSAVDDVAFTQSMVDALDALGIEPQVTPGTFVIEEAATALRGYAEDGVDVIIAHGTQYGGSLEEIAPDFPETTFIWGTATETKGLDNVFAYFPAADQGGYVNGIIAGALTESGTIGVVGPVEAGDAVAYIDGFKNGAEASGATEVSIVYTGSFGDVALAAETATAHIANGADILTGSAQMVVGAVGVASGEGVPWFGTQANQTELDPEIVVASQVYHWEVVLDDMLELREAGTLGGEVFGLTLENGGLVIEYNEAFDLDPEIKAAADAAIAGIIDGSVSTGV